MFPLTDLGQFHLLQDLLRSGRTEEAERLAGPSSANYPTSMLSWNFGGATGKGSFPDLSAASTRMKRWTVAKLGVAIDKASGIGELKKVENVAQAIEKLIRTQGEDLQPEQVQATDAVIRCKMKIGGLLKEPPGKGKGGGRGKKLSHMCDSLDKDEVSRCRKLAYKIEDGVYDDYTSWLLARRRVQEAAGRKGTETRQRWRPHQRKANGNHCRLLRRRWSFRAHRTSPHGC